jgi:hypothetical protein
MSPLHQRLVEEPSDVLGRLLGLADEDLIAGRRIDLGDQPHHALAAADEVVDAVARLAQGGAGLGQLAGHRLQRVDERHGLAADLVRRMGDAGRLRLDIRHDVADRLDDLADGLRRVAHVLGALGALDAVRHQLLRLALQMAQGGADLLGRLAGLRREGLDGGGGDGEAAAGGGDDGEAAAGGAGARASMVALRASMLVSRAIESIPAATVPTWARASCSPPSCCRMTPTASTRARISASACVTVPRDAETSPAARLTVSWAAAAALTISALLPEMPRALASSCSKEAACASNVVLSASTSPATSTTSMPSASAVLVSAVRSRLSMGVARGEATEGARRRVR